MPGTAEDVPFEAALAERPLQMEAVTLRRVEFVTDPREGQLNLADPDAGERPGLDLLDARDGLKFLRHGGRS